MSTPEIAAAVSAGPLRDLPTGPLNAILDNLLVVRVDSGATLYRPGAPVGLHVVVAGLVRVVVPSPEGRQVTVRYARTGELLGAPIVVGGTVPVTAHAVGVCTVGRTPPGLLGRLAADDARVALWVAQELSRRVHGLLAEIARNTFLPVRARLARHLLDLAAHDPASGELVAVTTQQQLADAVGTAREVVSRALAQLRAERVVMTSRDRIAVPDPVRLAALAEGHD